MIYIGIDTGVHTGFAVYDGRREKLVEVKCLKIHEAMQKVSEWKIKGIKDGQMVEVRVEDARQRTWFGHHTAKEDRARLQGAGSVKRDCQIWEDYLKDLGVDYEMVAPKNNTTKLSADSFRHLTKWQERTNEHSRDAAMLVYGF